MTSDVDWDPSTIDGEFPLTGDEEFFGAYDNGTNFIATGRYRQGTVVASARTVNDDPILPIQFFLTPCMVLRMISTMTRSWILTMTTPSLRP
jgi:hypothetical protein